MDSDHWPPRCKRDALITVLISQWSRHLSCVPDVLDIKISFAVCAVNGWRGGTRTHDRFLMEAYQTTVLHQLHHSPIKKQDACNNAIYWIRTNASSIAASALTTKLNVRMVDTNITLLYASSNSTRSKWPNHYDSLLYQLSYVLAYLERTAGLKPATNGFECKMNIAV